ncbi:MAG: DUF559 domain-containing protein [Thermoleophilia bacterium]|nr:DUF559 domain-containing protein [Thermoleophilia bacterium]
MTTLPPAQRLVLTTPLTIDGMMARVSALQFGVITFDQLVQCGVSQSAVSRRVGNGRLHRIYKGIYAVGHAALSREARCMAAHLAAGPDSVLSHWIAAEKWKLRDQTACRIEILSPRRIRGLSDATARQTCTLVAADIVWRDWLPFTTVPRSLVDLADVLSVYQLTHLMHQADYRNRFDLDATLRCAERNRTRAGYATLLRALEKQAAGSAGTRSKLEDRFLALVLSGGVIEPWVNMHISVPGDRSFEVDFQWSEQRLVVEVDGSGHRRLRTRLEDADRDVLLRAAGYRVLRFSGEDIERRGAETVAQVVVALEVHK